MLAVIFGVERFQTFVYGTSFTIESDHKPLESISQKNLADMPAHLQYMLLCLQGHDYTIHYHPSKEMALSDTLSQFSPCPGPNILLDIAIHHAHLSPERKEHSNKLLWVTLRCVLSPTWSSLVGPMTSRQSLTHYTHTLSYVEKPSLSLHQIGRGYYSNSTSSIKEPPKPSFSHVDVSSGQA